MTEEIGSLTALLSEVWRLVVWLLVVGGLVGCLTLTLRAVLATVFGARYTLMRSLGGGFHILFGAFLVMMVVPVIVITQSGEQAPSCGVLGNLVAGSFQLLSALVALRMGLAFLRVTFSAALSGEGLLSRGYQDAGAAYLGMLMSLAAGPVAAHFLGGC